MSFASGLLTPFSLVEATFYACHLFENRSDMDCRQCLHEIHAMVANLEKQLLERGRFVNDPVSDNRTMMYVG